jgi:hypothetical protein
MIPSQYSSSPSRTAPAFIRTHTTVALLGDDRVRALALGLAEPPGAAKQQRDLLAHRFERGDARVVDPLRALPPDQVEGAGRVAVGVHRHDQAGAVGEVMEELEREARIGVDVVAPGGGRRREDAVAEALLVLRC